MTDYETSKKINIAIRDWLIELSTEDVKNKRSFQEFSRNMGIEFGASPLTIKRILKINYKIIIDFDTGEIKRL